MYHEPRKNIRLHDFDYSSNGAYFITFCVKNRWGILGEICDVKDEKKCVLSAVGEVVNSAISEIPKHYENVNVPYFVVMPNHVHLIMVIDSGRQVAVPTDTGDAEKGRQVAVPTDAGDAEKGRQVAVPTVIGHLKRAVSMKLGYSIWQTRFYDHVIRDRDDYLRIVEYINNNPSTWTDDEYFI